MASKGAKLETENVCRAALLNALISDSKLLMPMCLWLVEESLLTRGFLYLLGTHTEVPFQSADYMYICSSQSIGSVF